MSKKNRAADTAAAIALAPPVNGKFYTTAKVDHLLYCAYEIEVKDGVVVGVKCLSRAPDLAATAIGACTRDLWVNMRTQPEVPDAG